MSDLKARLAVQGVHTLLVQFTDVHGAAKGKLVPLAHLDDVLGLGAGFAGPSIWGTGLPRTGPRAEYYARGDANTAMPLPWMPGVARIVGDGFVDGQAFEACPCCEIVGANPQDATQLRFGFAWPALLQANRCNFHEQIGGGYRRIRGFGKTLIKVTEAVPGFVFRGYAMQTRACFAIVVGQLARLRKSIGQSIEGAANVFGAGFPNFSGSGRRGGF